MEKLAAWMGLAPPTRFCVRRPAGYVRPAIWERSAMIMNALAQEIAYNSGSDQQRAEFEGIDGPDGLRVIANHGQNQKRQRRDAHGNGAGKAAGNAIRPREPRLADAQHYQRGKLQKNTQARQQHIEHDQFDEAEPRSEEH